MKVCARIHMEIIAEIRTSTRSFPELKGEKLWWFFLCFVLWVFLIGQWYFKCKITSRKIQRELYYLKFLLIF